MIDKKYGFSRTQVYKYGFKLCLEVFENNNRKCELCGGINRLSIHHLDHSGQSENPNNNIENLQLLCHACHMSLHARIRFAKKGKYLVKGREKEYRREYYQKNKDKLTKQKTDWARNNQDKVKQSNKKSKEKYKEKHKEYQREYQKMYQKKHKEHLKEYKRLYFQNSKIKGEQLMRKHCLNNKQKLYVISNDFEHVSYLSDDKTNTNRGTKK